MFCSIIPNLQEKIQNIYLTENISFALVNILDEVRITFTSLSIPVQIQFVLKSNPLLIFFSS